MTVEVRLSSFLQASRKLISKHIKASIYLFLATFILTAGMNWLNFSLALQTSDLYREITRFPTLTLSQQAQAIESFQIKAQAVQTNALIFLGVIVLVLLVMLFVQYSVALVYARFAENKPVGLMAAHWHVFKRLIPLFLTLLLYLVLSLPTTLILIGFFYILVWNFALMIVITEKKSGLEALKASHALVYRRVWKTLGYLLIGLIPTLILTSVINSLVGMNDITSVAGVLNVTTIPYVGIIVSGVATSILTVILNAYITAMFIAYKQNPISISSEVAA